MKHRITALLLSVVIVLGLMTGCGNTEDKPADKQNADGRQQYAYQAVTTALGNDLLDGYIMTNINSFCVSGNTVYLTADFLSQGDLTTSVYVDPASAEHFEDESAYCTALIAIDLATQNVIKADYTQSVLPEGSEGSYSLSELCAGPDGTVWVIETAETYTFDLPANFDPLVDSKWSYYTPAESIVNILQFGPDGKLISTSPVQIDGEIGSYFNFMADHSGNLYCTDLSNIFVYSKDGSLLSTVSYSDGYLVQLGTFGVGLMAFDLNGNSVIKRIDAETGTFMPDLILENGAAVPHAGNANYIYTYVSDGKIYGIEASGEQTVEVLDFLACDINDNRISTYMVLDDSSVVALQTGSDEEETAQYELVTITMTDVSSQPEKTIITLGAEMVPDRIKDHIIQFNTTNDGIRVQIVNLYDSETTPDVIMTDLIPVEQYAANGKLVDLRPYIEQDDNISDNDLMMHLFEAASIDGKLYEAASYFKIYTVAGEKSRVGATGTWTQDDLALAMNTLSADATIFGSESAADNFLSNYLYKTLDNYVAWQQGSGEFENTSFVAMLDFAKRLTEDGIKASEINDRKSTEYSRLYSGTQLLTVNEINSLDEIKYANAMHRGEAAFVGYPTSDNTGNLLYLINPVAITTDCKNPDAAWSFVKSFLTEEYQSLHNQIGFPTNKHAFENYIAFEMEPVYEIDENGSKVEVSSGTIRLEGILKLELYAATEEEYNQFIELYESCSTMARTNAFLTELIRPEIETMLNNNVDAAATAAQINAIVNDYLKEE